MHNTFKINIAPTLETLLTQEDTDNDKKITIEDKGPKVFTITSADNKQTHTVKGTYFLSNLLQELVFAKNEGKTFLEFDVSKIEEPPVDRISRLIKDYYWQGLTRTMDKDGIENLISDTKNDALTADVLPVYVPFKDVLAFNYYKKLEDTLAIKVVKLPEQITPDYVKSINTKPGILSLKLNTNNGKVQAVPFVVPGGRFNEMYGWDSYFESVGLIIDNKVHLAKAMADNFKYQIDYYGKILNANRSYYLTRTQPPLYSSLITEVYAVTKDKQWLKAHLLTAIKEYNTVWMTQGVRQTKNGLNRYYAQGIGVAPECEAGHFDAIIAPFANAANLEINTYLEHYNSGKLKNSTLDTYFLNDRSVRESGHDTSYRIDGNCTDLNLVELNAMLYKYETDFATLIATEFNNSLEEYTSEFWAAKADKRQQLVNTYLWNSEKSMYFDYNIQTKTQSTFVSATTFAPLWCNMASQDQANALVRKAVPLLKQPGGIAGSTKQSRGAISSARPQRQWDYPNGWAPHQMVIWQGLQNYGFTTELQELVYRWLYMITINAVNYNGTIPEKYDVVAATHKVFAEYGNVGTDFEYITQEGFGWMNASYQLGLSLLDTTYKTKLNNLTPPETLF